LPEFQDSSEQKHSECGTKVQEGNKVNRGDAPDQDLR
jgi:hypothetical protein